MVGDISAQGKGKRGKKGKGKGKGDERSFKFSEIIHPHRHSDLRKMIYLPDPDNATVDKPIDSVRDPTKRT